jgi:hypothetical protein
MTLNSLSNYTLKFSGSYSGLIPNDTIYLPIPPVVVDSNFANPILIVDVNTTIPEGAYWSYGGWLRQVIPLDAGFAIAGGHRLELGTNLVQMNFDATYQVILYLPKYFRDATINIYELNI